MHIGSLIFGTVRTVILDGHAPAATGIHVLIGLHHLAVILRGKKRVTTALYVNALVELFLSWIYRVVAHTVRGSHKHEFIPFHGERVA